MDVTSIFKAVFALAIVLGLILALAYGLRRYAPNILARLSAPRGRKRLEVVETLVLDPTRRVVIVRVDDQERLILLGEGHELIEPRPHAETRDSSAGAAPRPRPVAVPAPKQAPPKVSPPPGAAAHAARAKLAAARAAYPRPTPQDPNDDLF